MRLVKRAAITVTPKQPYLDWANNIDDGPKIGEDYDSEKPVYLIQDIMDVVPFDRDVVVRPYYEIIFEEELNAWYELESVWPSTRTYEMFLEWFEVEVHSMVIDLEGSRRISTEPYK